MRTAVQFGAGNIGRGFMGQLFWEAGYRTIFVEANEMLVQLLNERKAYTLRLLDAYLKEAVELRIDRFEALHLGQQAEIAEAVANADLLCTAVGVKSLAAVARLLAAGFRLRAKKSSPQADVWLCENLLGAAGILERQVAGNLDERALDWLKANVGFVGTAVARMVPSAENRRPQDDPLLVISDAHHELPFDAGAVRGPVPDIAGLRPAPNFKVEMERKLYTHNLGHASLAYLGRRKGYRYVHEGFKDPMVSGVFDGALQETAQALVKKYPRFLEEEEHRRIRQDVRIRFANPMIMDTIKRVGKDPIRKLGIQERLIGSAQLCYSQGVFPERILTVCAAALCYDEPDDPDAVRLQQMIREQGIERVLKELTGLESTCELGGRIKNSYLALKCNTEGRNS